MRSLNITTTYMKHILSSIILSICTLVSYAQNNEPWAWPIAGQDAGQGIIYKPQDYIEKEFNFDHLFIEAEQGTNVICPADAVVSSTDIIYQESLEYFNIFHWKNNLDSCTLEARKEARMYHLMDSYVTHSISLKIGDKELHISGLHIKNPFKSGTKIAKGTNIGTVDHAYHAISRPHLMVEVSISGISADPMSPFGLKSTFKAPIATKPKETLTHAEAEADYRKLASSVREIYPSLTDLMSLEEYDAFVEQQVKLIPASISLADFAQLIQYYNEKIHDSHLNIDCPLPKKPVPQGHSVMYSPLNFGEMEGKCLVIMTTDKYKDYIGKEIVKIDGKPALEVCAISRHKNNLYDAKVQSVQDYHVAYRAGFDYAEHCGPQKPGSKIVLDFADEEHLEATLIKHQYDYFIDHQRYFGWYYYSNLANHKHLRCYRKVVNDSIWAIALTDFQLNEVETDTLLGYIHEAEAKHIPHLIFDIRDNPGGNSELLDKVTKALMGRWHDTPHRTYQIANSSIFKSEIDNYIPNEPILGWMYPVKGKEGLYSLTDDSGSNSTFGIDSLGYNGKLYVLIDSRSASAAAYLAGCIKRNRRGLLFGRETMSGYHVETCIKFASIHLDNSQFTARIPMVRAVIDDTVNDRLPAGRGVIPDFNFPMTFEEYYCKKNYVYRKALEYITGEKQF